MVFQLLYFFIISFFCMAWGLPFVFNRKEKVNAQGVLLSFFVGLAVICLLASWIGLFTALHFKILLLCSVPVILLNIKMWKMLFSFNPRRYAQKLSVFESVFVPVCILLFWFLSTGKPTMEDTDLYHIQTIKWIHEYGTVPGLANLYLRFGFYSNWFHAISIFDLPFLNRNFLYLNFTFVVWVFLFLFYQYKKYVSSKGLIQKHLSVFLLCILFFMLAEWNLFRVASSSTSYDFAVSATVLICLSLLIEKIVGLTKTNEFILLILLLTAPFYKLTGFFLLPFWFLLFYLSKKKVQVFLVSALVLAAGLIPFVVKNLVQTGYPFYPYQFLNFLKPEWQVPSSMVSMLNKYIYLSNHYINQSIPGFPTTDGSSFSFFKDWFLHLVKAHQMLIVFCFISLPIGWKSLKKIYQQCFPKILLLYLLCIPAFIAWLIASPDPRFAFGFLIFIVFFPVSAIVSSYVRTWMIDASIITMSLFILIYIGTKGQKQFSAANILYPLMVDAPPYNKVMINNRNYNIPQPFNGNWNLRCMNDPLPCIYEKNLFLQPRGDKISDGFKMNPNPDSAFILKYYY